MKRDWDEYRIGDIADILNGFAFKSNKYVKEGIRVIRITNVQKGYIEDTEPRYYPYSEEKTIKKYILYEGDLLMSLTGNVGRVGLLPSELLPCALNQRVGCLRIKNNNVFKQFLFHYFNSDLFENKCIAASSGVAQMNMSTEWLKEQTIFIPSLSEQKRIVVILDKEFEKIDALKENAEKNLQNAKDLFQAALKKELEPKKGWKQYLFEDLCTFNKEQGVYPQLKYIGMENIVSGAGTTIGFQDGSTIQGTSFRFYKGEVLYGRLRPYLKKVFVAEFDGCCSTEVFPIRTKGIIPHYLKYWFLTDSITDRINATCGGCRMPRANMNDVKQFVLSIPNIDIQKQIVSRLDKLNTKCKELQDNYDKTITLCDDLKQALLRKAFNGEL